MPDLPKSAQINTSVFELFKAGPGPSSSHTIGPMLASCAFRHMIDALPPEKRGAITDIQVTLLGSLSATGHGHGTHCAVVTGLLGFVPESCPAGLPVGVLALSPAERSIYYGDNTLILSAENVFFGPVDHAFPHSNTMVFKALGAAKDDVVLEGVCYSVGGGFVVWEGEEAPQRHKVPYPYTTAARLLELTQESGLSIANIVLLNEIALTGVTVQEVFAHLDSVIELMRKAVARGTSVSGALPGTLNVYRKAAHLASKADTLDDPVNRFLGLLNAYAFAVAEENAAGGIIVTAPTCGAAGVLPAILTMIEGWLGLGPESVRNGLLAAASVGFLAKHNAGIAGAEYGCQGEVGVASAMAAAMLAQARGYPPLIVQNAAEIALEHHLGLTCDPVGGYVQIPCIERNAMGALKAYNACLVAATEDVTRHRVSLDMAIRAMAETGRDMHSKYKETSLGGLAVCMAEC